MAGRWDGTAAGTGVGAGVRCGGGGVAGGVAVGTAEGTARGVGAGPVRGVAGGMKSPWAVGADGTAGISGRRVATRAAGTVWDHGLVCPPTAGCTGAPDRESVGRTGFTGSASHRCESDLGELNVGASGCAAWPVPVGVFRPDVPRRGPSSLWPDSKYGSLRFLGCPSPAPRRHRAIRSTAAINATTITRPVSNCADPVSDPSGSAPNGTIVSMDYNRTRVVVRLRRPMGRPGRRPRVRAWSGPDLARGVSQRGPGRARLRPRSTWPGGGGR